MRNKSIWLLLIISLGIIGLITASIINPHNTKPEPAPGNPVVSNESGESAGHKIAHLEPQKAVKKETNVAEPLPGGNKAPEPALKPEQLINTWRQAIINKNPKDIERSGLAIKGLGQEAVPLLKKQALEDDNERVRAFAVRALGRMRNAELAALFVDLLQKDKSQFVRENAAWSLGELGDTAGIAKLQPVADSDESEQVRNAAKKAIETIQANNNK